MPISARIASAAQNYKQNASFLKQTVDGLTEAEWLVRPNDHTNHMLWIAGHVTWARTMLLARLNAPWTMPWISLYGRSAPCASSPDCPSPADVMTAWNESCTRIHAAMEAASEELLDMPITKGPPTHDGKLSGVVDFLAFHETYHVGQMSYIRSWLGKKGVMG
jgi:hypothetical protein